MMTLSRLSAGDGYSYYTSVTAKGDLDRASSELGDYYLETGAPQGVWLGRGAAAIGIEGTVTEAQMKALFGEGLHPNADQLIPQHIANGLTAEQAIKAVRLGRKYANYRSPDNELRNSIEHATKREEAALGRQLTPEQHQHIRMREAGILFRDRHGRSGNRVEIAKFLTTELSKGKNANAGFDLTFSVPKSVSIAWAAADPATAKTIEQAHERAIEATLTWLETHAIRSQTGAQGIALETTNGLIATRFRHWESRDNDPQLHDHVVIANRVQVTGANGQPRWLTIDSRGLYKAAMAASSMHNRYLADELKQAGFQLRTRTTGTYQGIELAAVTDHQIERFSQRSNAIDHRTNQLVTDYINRHGHHPGTKELLQLRQQATLETRKTKTTPKTLQQLRNTWNTQLGTDADTIRNNLTTTQPTPPSPTIDPQQIAAHIIHQLAEERATWSPLHVETRLNIWAAAQPTAIPQHLLDTIKHHALHTASVAITPTPTLPDQLPAELYNPDGSSIYQRPNNGLYTSAQVLEAEDLLLNAARTLALPSITQEHLDTAHEASPRRLDANQYELAKTVACGEHIITAGIGPAGSGKTTALKIAVEAAKSAGVGTHGVSFSAVAADQLQQATGMESTTIAKWLLNVEQGHTRIKQGDIIIVDEAGMASTPDLARITQHALDAGAFVRLIGDDRQLQAIGSGGALKLITAEHGAVELDTLWRFKNQDEAQAGLQLREHGNIDWYLNNDRIKGGTAHHIYNHVVQQWRNDELNGHSSLIMAETRREVRLLNELAQDLRIQASEVDSSRLIPLADGNSAGIGDRIVTRHNNRRLTTDNGHAFVKNGDNWTVTHINHDGSLTVEDDHNRHVTLPTEYVQQHTGLGYASTIHRAQGRTVDHARVIVNQRTSREGLYVGLTRGQYLNEAYAITEGQSAAATVQRAANNITQTISAHEHIRQAQNEADHPATLARTLHDMQRRADQHRYTNAIHTTIPEHAEQLLDSPKQHRLFTALARAEDAGFSPNKILTLCATELPNTNNDPTGLITWRIQRHLTHAANHALQDHNRPYAHLTNTQLEAALDHANQRLDHTNQTLAATRPTRLEDGTYRKAWTQRPYGNLTDTELAERLHTTRHTINDLHSTRAETRRELANLRIEIRNETPSPGITQRRIHTLETRLQQHTDALAMAHTNEAHLRRETTTRAQQSPEEWGRETIQRAIGNIEPVTKETAQQHALIARHTQRHLWLEHHHRQLEPDQPQHRSQPTWAIPARDNHDPHTPQTWRAPLTQMASHVDTAIREKGAALAMQPPTWATTYLGPVPTPESPQRAQWELTAGRIDTARALTGHNDPTRALPTPSQARNLSHNPASALHSLHTAASDLRTNSRPQPEHTNQPTPETPTQTPTNTQPTEPPTPTNRITQLVNELTNRLAFLTRLPHPVHKPMPPRAPDEPLTSYITRTQLDTTTQRAPNNTITVQEPLPEPTPAPTPQRQPGESTLDYLTRVAAHNSNPTKTTEPPLRQPGETYAQYTNRLDNASTPESSPTPERQPGESTLDYITRVAAHNSNPTHTTEPPLRQPGETYAQYTNRLHAPETQPAPERRPGETILDYLTRAAAATRRQPQRHAPAHEQRTQQRPKQRHQERRRTQQHESHER